MEFISENYFSIGLESKLFPVVSLQGLQSLALKVDIRFREGAFFDPGRIVIQDTAESQKNLSSEPFPHFQARLVN